MSVSPPKLESSPPGPPSEAEPSRKRPVDRRGRPLIVAEKLSKLFAVGGGAFRKARFVHAVDGVSLYLRRGETLGLVGESGCGKSTLGRTLIRLVEPTLGRVLFDDLDLTRMPAPELRALRRRMQIIFQDPQGSLNPRMTVAEIVGEGITIHGLANGPRDTEAKVAAVLEKVGLSADLMRRYPHEFSGGQRQRIGIARALAVEPDFIVCDEPVSALDVSVQAQILNLLERLQERLGLAVLFISHDLRAVQYTSHRIGVMYLGRIVETGPSAVVAEKRYHPYTRALFSAMPSFEPADGRADGKRRLVLAGEPPSAIDPPSGCAFHPRCPAAEPGVCDVKQPELREIVEGSHHRVACWHPQTSRET